MQPGLLQHHFRRRPRARHVLRRLVQQGHLLKLLAISKRSVAELAGQATIEQTICVHVLALAVVMAGSGDLEVIWVVRY